MLEDGNHFRCPKCGEEYVPWKAMNKTGKKKMVDFQKVVQILNVHDPKAPPMIFPARWPGSEADSWLLSQAELYAASIMYEGDIAKYMKDSLRSMDQLCARVGVPKGMQHFAWDPEIEHRLGSCRKEGPRGWLRFQAAGFWGNILDTPPNGKFEVFTEWRLLIELLGQLIFCNKEISRTFARA